MSEKRKAIETYINQIDSLTLEIAEAGIDDDVVTKIINCFDCKKARAYAKKLKGDIVQPGA